MDDDGNIMWLKQLKNTHLGMVNIAPIYGDDWGMVYYCFNHIIIIYIYYIIYIHIIYIYIYLLSYIIVYIYVI